MSIILSAKETEGQTLSENYNDKLQELLNAQKSMEDAKKDPQNTVITKVLTFYIDDQVYGIEIPDVIEIIEVPPITAVPGLHKRHNQCQKQDSSGRKYQKQIRQRRDTF